MGCLRVQMVQLQNEYTTVSNISHQILVLHVEPKVAEIHLLEFVLVQIRPAPNLGVNHVGETFAGGDLEHNMWLIVAFENFIPLLFLICKHSRLQTLPPQLHFFEIFSIDHLT